MIWWKINVLKLNKPTSQLFKVSSHLLTFIKKVYSSKSTLSLVVSNKTPSWTISSTFKKKDGKKMKSKTKSLENPSLLIMVTIESTRLPIWISPKTLWITCKLIMLPNLWWIITRKVITSLSPIPNNLFWFIKESLVKKKTNKSNNYIWSLNYVNSLVSSTNRKMILASNKNWPNIPNLMLNLDFKELMTTPRKFKVSSEKTKTMSP